MTDILEFKGVKQAKNLALKGFCLDCGKKGKCALYGVSETKIAQYVVNGKGKMSREIKNIWAKIMPEGEMRVKKEKL